MGAADDGGLALALAQGRTLSRHRRIPPSILVLWCLGGPRDDEVGPVPEQREDGGVIKGHRLGDPAELPRILDQGEI